MILKPFSCCGSVLLLYPLSRSSSSCRFYLLYKLCTLWSEIYAGFFDFCPARSTKSGRKQQQLVVVFTDGAVQNLGCHTDYREVQCREVVLRETPERCWCKLQGEGPKTAEGGGSRAERTSGHLGPRFSRLCMHCLCSPADMQCLVCCFPSLKKKTMGGPWPHCWKLLPRSPHERKHL